MHYTEWVEEIIMRSTARDLTEGNILKQILMFALPLMFGNIFQMLYNTVDSIVVGQFVGTEALAAVGSTTMITNMAVFFFNGFSVGAGVVIGRYFGAKDMKKLHLAIETTMASTFLLCVLFTVGFISAVDFMLKFMDTPADVFHEAAVYLRIYFGGISGLLIYNIGSGILRAVGDTTRPLMFLILTSVMNIILDLLFVIPLHMGIAGVAYATILSQFISAALTLLLLIRTHDIYRLEIRDLTLDRARLKEIFSIGLPNGIQSVITAFSNVFVQSYINFFGSIAMAGWGCYNKIDQFIMLPMASVAMAATTFVSQNVGAKKFRRADEGTRTSIMLTLSITGMIALLIWIFAEKTISMFTQDEGVIAFGTFALRQNVFFLMFNSVNQVLAAAMRGRGDSTGPMMIMLITFVLFRQIYLFVVTRYIANIPSLVAFGYPFGWITCCILEVLYFWIRHGRRGESAE